MKAILLRKTKDIHLLMFYKTVKVRNFFFNLLLTPVVVVFVNWNYVGLLCKTKDIHLLMFYKTVKVRNYFFNLLLTPLVLVFVNWNYIGLS